MRGSLLKSTPVGAGKIFEKSLNVVLIDVGDFDGVPKTLPELELETLKKGETEPLPPKMAMLVS